MKHSHFSSSDTFPILLQFQSLQLHIISFFLPEWSTLTAVGPWPLFPKVSHMYKNLLIP